MRSGAFFAVSRYDPRPPRTVAVECRRVLGSYPPRSGPRKYGTSSQAVSEGLQDRGSLGPLELKSRGAHAWGSPSQVGLDELDLLDELRTRIQSEEGEEPPEQLGGMGRVPTTTGLEQGHGLVRQPVRQSRHPPDSAGAQALEDRFIQSHRDLDPGPEERTEGGDPTDVAARLLHSGQVGVCLRQLEQLLRQHVG